VNLVEKNRECFSIYSIRKMNINEKLANKLEINYNLLVAGDREHKHLHNPKRTTIFKHFVYLQLYLDHFYGKLKF